MLTYGQKAPPAPPSADKRWKIVAAAMRRQGYAPDALIEVLHAVQEAFGYLDTTALRYVAVSLRVPLSRAYGVASFYDYFTLRPAGENARMCVICTGTACHIKGAPGLLDAVKARHAVGPGETTADGRFALVTARCLGSCGAAPAAVLEGEVLSKVTPETLLKRLDAWSAA